MLMNRVHNCTCWWWCCCVRMWSVLLLFYRESRAIVSVFVYNSLSTFIIISLLIKTHLFSSSQNLYIHTLRLTVAARSPPPAFIFVQSCETPLSIHAVCVCVCVDANNIDWMTCVILFMGSLSLHSIRFVHWNCFVLHFLGILSYM